nr:transcriptional regulator GcvA [uncultured Pseudomonas sp.]
MARRIPPLNPLHVFEVVSRTGNLTVAAQELHVTQSAVSRQIAVLEGYLGVELFRRERQGVTLTHIGQTYADQVVPAFDAIAGATEKMLANTTKGALRVRTYTAFAAKWLIPRLPDFQRAHPQIDVEITTAVPQVDFDRHMVDLAIQMGDGDWPRVQADRLFLDEFEPVCSPRYLAENAPDPRRPEALLSKRLLISQYRRTDWDEWLAEAGLIQEAKGVETMTFNTSVLTWQAAIDGLGMAIGQTAMLTNEFNSGQLVRPFSHPVRSGRAYWLLRPSVQRESQKVSVFRAWLLAKSREMALQLDDDLEVLV